MVVSTQGAPRPMSTPIGTEDQFLPARRVRERYGSIANMTLWRWLQDADLNFPRPIRIGQRRYWRLSDLVAWEKSRCAKSVSTINPSIEQRLAGPKTAPSATA
jgi:predicted DNA-binding transcriptional regulator AlpA